VYNAQDQHIYKCPRTRTKTRPQAARWGSNTPQNTEFRSQNAEYVQKIMPLEMRSDIRCIYILDIGACTLMCLHSHCRCTMTHAWVFGLLITLLCGSGYPLCCCLLHCFLGGSVICEIRCEANGGSEASKHEKITYNTQRQSGK
jgi:hypothetical protein